MGYDETNHVNIFSFRSQSGLCNIRSQVCRLVHVATYIQRQSPSPPRQTSKHTRTLPPMSSACTPPVSLVLCRALVALEPRKGAWRLRSVRSLSSNFEIGYKQVLYGNENCSWRLTLDILIDVMVPTRGPSENVGNGTVSTGSSQGQFGYLLWLPLPVSSSLWLPRRLPASPSMIWTSQRRLLHHTRTHRFFSTNGNIGKRWFPSPRS